MSDTTCSGSVFHQSLLRRAHIATEVTARGVPAALALVAMLSPAARAEIGGQGRAAPVPRDTVLTYHAGPVAPRQCWILRFQMGKGALRGDAGVPGAVLNEGGEAGSSMVAALAGLRPLNGWSAAGLELRCESNAVTLAPQSFTVGSLDLLLRGELGRTGLRRHPGTLVPYLQIGAGWALHWTNAQRIWVGMANGGPDGVPTAMSVRSSPAFESALGLDVQANRFLSINLQAGWRVDSPRYRMSVAAEPDRTGTLRLSGVCVCGGVKFLVAPLVGARW